VVSEKRKSRNYLKQLLMKKKSIKNLGLNKKSISNLANYVGGAVNTNQIPDRASAGKRSMDISCYMSCANYSKWETCECMA